MSDGNPDASVIIPVYNGASTIAVQLDALAQQVGAPRFEVIVADNGSTDTTRQVAMSFVDRLDVRIVDARARRGPSHARNRGAEVARAPALLFCDADDRVGRTWVGALHRALEHNGLATGPIIYRDARSLHRDLVEGDARPTAPRRFLDSLPFAGAGNLAMRAAALRSLGGFDEELHCGEDADLTIRAQFSGEALAWADDATLYTARRERLVDAAKQFFRYGYYDVLVYRKLRSHVLTPRSIAEMLRPYLVLMLTVHRVFIPHRRWSWIVNVSQRAGRILGSIRYRVLFL